MRKIIFDKSFGAFDPPEAFILSDKDLNVALENLPAPAAVGEHHLVFVNEDGEERTHKLSGNDVITIPRDFLKPGLLLGKVVRMVHGKPVRPREIEPLIIAQLDTDITVSPVIAAFRAEIDELKGVFTVKEQVLHAKIKMLTETVEVLRGNTKNDIATSCENVLKTALKAADDNAVILNEKVSAMGELVRKAIGKRKGK